MDAFVQTAFSAFAVYSPNTGVLAHNRVEATTKVRRCCLRSMWLTSNSRSIRLWASRSYAYVVKLRAAMERGAPEAANNVSK